MDDGPADRQANFYDVEILVVAIKRYTDDTGVPPNDWVDDQVSWFEENIFNLLTDARLTVDLGEGVEYWPQSATVEAVLPKYLKEDHCFYSELNLTFRRLKPGVKSTLTQGS
jgi:hypothetical protein